MGISDYIKTMSRGQGSGFLGRPKNISEWIAVADLKKEKAQAHAREAKANVYLTQSRSSTASFSGHRKRSGGLFKGVIVVVGIFTVISVLSNKEESSLPGAEKSHSAIQEPLQNTQVSPTEKTEGVSVAGAATFQTPDPGGTQSEMDETPKSADAPSSGIAPTEQSKTEETPPVAARPEVPGTVEPLRALVSRGSVQTVHAAARIAIFANGQQGRLVCVLPADESIKARIYSVPRQPNGYYGALAYKADLCPSAGISLPRDAYHEIIFPALLTH